MRITLMIKNIRNILLPLFVMAITSACESDDKDSPDTTPPTTTVSRTVLVYMVADNSLGRQYGRDDADLTEMLDGVKDGGLNGGRLLVYHNRPYTSNGNPPEMLEVTEAGLKVLKTYPDDPSIYSVDPERISEVMADMKTLAPANDYGLVLWSHANSWLGPATEDDPMYRSFGEDRGAHITVQTLASTLSDEAFKFVYFDCCLMGNVETLYELRHLAPVMVASPTELHIDGMPYDENVPLMFLEEPDMETAAENTYQYYVSSNNPCQMTVINTAGLEGLATATRAIMETVEDYPSYSEIMSLQRYSKPGEVCNGYDMEQYMELLAADREPELLEAWRNALDGTVDYMAATTSGIGGLVIDLDHYCGLASFAFRDFSDISWRGYNTLQWWYDVVSVTPALSSL